MKKLPKIDHITTQVQLLCQINKILNEEKDGNSIKKNFSKIKKVIEFNNLKKKAKERKKIFDKKKTTSDLKNVLNFFGKFEEEFSRYDATLPIGNNVDIKNIDKDLSKKKWKVI